MHRALSLLRRPRNAVATVVIVLIAIVGVFVVSGRGSAPPLPVVEISRGDFVDTLEIRGEIRPLRSIVLSSPIQAGELQIVKLARSGTMVKPGDVVVQFDGSTLQ